MANIVESLPLAEIIYKSMISCEPRTAQQGAADAANAIIDLVRAIECGEYSDLPPLGDSRRPRHEAEDLCPPENPNL